MEMPFQWIFQVPVKGGKGLYNPLEGKDYKWYISGIFPANWGDGRLATDPTELRGTSSTTIDLLEAMIVQLPVVSFSMVFSSFLSIKTMASHLSLRTV